MTSQPSSSVLRPIRFRHRRQPVPGLEAHARRGAAVLQREVQLLRVEPIRRRRAALPDWKTYQSGRGTTADILFAASKYHRASCCSRIHPCTTYTESCCPGCSPPAECWPSRTWCANSVSRTGSAARLGRLRLRCQPRRFHADADDRLSARHPRGGQEQIRDRTDKSIKRR